MRLDVRVSRTATDQLSDIEDDDVGFGAWNELRRLQHGDAPLPCRTGGFADYWCPSGRIGFRVSRPSPGIPLVWRLLALAR